DGSTTDDIELKISDLSGERSLGEDKPSPLLCLRWLGQIVHSRGDGLSSPIRFSPRVRLWRLVIVGCTVLLALLFILGSFPSARDWLNGLFAHLTPIPTGFQGGGKPHPYTVSSIQGTPGVIRVVPPGPGQAPSLLSREGTVVFWDTDATPGLAP